VGGGEPGAGPRTGFRFGLGEGQKWYVMGGFLQVPVSGPQSYVWQPNFAPVKNY
jgi:hypothetical protein